ECRPCVLYFQEIESLLEPGVAAAERLHSQFLTELSGTVDCNEGVLVVASTEAPWAVDPGLVGAFDQRLFVGAPDAADRVAIMEILMRGKPFESVDLSAIAASTVGFSVTDLKHMLGLATEVRLREALDSGRPQPITGQDLLTAASTISASVPAWFDHAHEHASPERPGFWFSDVARAESA
ncbi:MAG: transitional endoplasmic reticulum ATPase, partial [Gammaproteobacteria bacterium]